MANVKELLGKPWPASPHEATNPSIGSVTSSFFVSMDQLLVNTDYDPGTNMANCIQLLYFNSIEQRVTSGNTGSQFPASATIVHSLVELHLPMQADMPTLRQNLRGNDNIVEMQVLRVGHVGGADLANTVIYAAIFKNCHIESIEEFPDKIIVKVRVHARADYAKKISADSMVGDANTASTWDYVKNTAGDPPSPL